MTSTISSLLPPSTPHIFAVRTRLAVLWGVLLLLLPLFSSPSFGSASLMVVPNEVQLKAPRPGSKVTEEIQVLNSGDVPLHIFSYTQDWTLTQKGEYELAGAGTNERSCAKWIQINPVEFTLAPQKTMKVRFSVSTPEDLSREHWAMMFFQSRPLPPKESASVKVAVAARIGCIVSVAPRGELRRAPRILDMNLQPALAPASEVPAPAASTSAASPGGKGGQQVKVTVENTGLVGMRLKGVAEARRADGTLAAMAPLARVRILSGFKRDVSATFENALPPGTYHIKAILDSGTKELVSGEMETTIVAPGVDDASSVTPDVDAPKVG